MCEASCFGLYWLRYGLNNPLIYTDPDGEWIHLIIGAVIGGTFNLIMNANNIDNLGQGLAYFGIGAVAGALSAGVGMGVTASLSGASFGAGFVGTQSAMTAISTSFTSSFLTGAAVGGAAGFSGGFTSGFGNGLMDGQNFGEALGNGLKTGAVAGVSGALMGGVLGGLDAVYGDPNHQRNFWSGDDIAMGRKPFALNNTDRAFNAYRSTRRYETRSYYEGILDGSKGQTYHDYIRYGDAPPNQISNGAVSKINNYTMPEDGIVNYTVENFRGRADMMILDQASHDVVIRVNGNIITPTNGYIPLWEGTRSVSVQIVNTNTMGGVISPYKFRIIGYINW